MGTFHRRNVRLRFSRSPWNDQLRRVPSIENIAASTGQTVEFVIKDLEQMIKKRFFADARIDKADNIIAIGRIKKSEETLQTTTSIMEPYICAGCGAHGMKPKGSNINCDFCGSTI